MIIKKLIFKKKLKHYLNKEAIEKLKFFYKKYCEGNFFKKNKLLENNYLLYNGPTKNKINNIYPETN